MLHIALRNGIIRLVAEAHEFAPVGQDGIKAILLGLVAMYVEGGEVASHCIPLFAVGYGAEYQPIAYISVKSAWYHHSAEGVKHLYGFIVTIHGECAAVVVGIHHLRYAAHHPYHAQYVVGVAMGEKCVMQGVKVDSCLLKLCQYAVAAAGIYQEVALAGI